MNWQEQREEWNRNNECAREACRCAIVRDNGRTRRVPVHTCTGLRYCKGCGIRIQRAQGSDSIRWESTEGSVVAVEEDGEFFYAKGLEY